MTFENDGKNELVTPLAKIASAQPRVCFRVRELEVRTLNWSLSRMHGRTTDSVDYKEEGALLEGSFFHHRILNMYANRTGQEKFQCFCKLDLTRHSVDRTRIAFAAPMRNNAVCYTKRDFVSFV